MAKELPSFAFEPGGGLLTNFNPEKINGLALKASKNADGFGTFQAWGKMPGSSRKSDLADAAWESLNYFEYFDPALVFRREALGLAGTKFYRIETSGALTVLRSDMIAGFLRGFTKNDRIHLTGPENDPFKYDGDRTTRWGIRGPSADENLILPIDDSSDWTPNGTNTVADEADVSKGGTGSVQVNKVDVTTALVSITQASLALTLTGFGVNALAWLYVPPGGLRLLAKSGKAASVQLGSSPNSIYEFEVGELFTGWNLLSFILSDPDANTGILDLTNVDAVTLSLHFESIADAFNGFLWNKLFIFDDGRPTMDTIRPKLTKLSTIASNSRSSTTCLTTTNTAIRLAMAVVPENVRN